jgi:chemotaxis protein MotB
MRSRSEVIICAIIAGLVVFALCGCTVVFQKGRKSDVDRIYALEDEVDRLSKIKAELEEKLRGIEGVSLSMENRGLVITFLDEILFDSGKIVVKANAMDALDRVAGVITSKASDLNIGVEGHTDSDPIKYSGFKSNWELSASRATSVLHYLESKGVSSQRMAAIGYGEHRPVADNGTAAGKRKNRRVEIVILPELKKISKDAKDASGSALLEPKENLK